MWLLMCVAVDTGRRDQPYNSVSFLSGKTMTSTCPTQHRANESSPGRSLPPCCHHITQKANCQDALTDTGPQCLIQMHDNGIDQKHTAILYMII